jgi:hypothetical protein
MFNRQFFGYFQPPAAMGCRSVSDQTNKALLTIEAVSRYEFLYGGRYSHQS